jgi:hypothetical protein
MAITRAGSNVMSWRAYQPGCANELIELDVRLKLVEDMKLGIRALHRQAG